MVELYNWNPHPYVFRGRLRRVLPIKHRRPVNNFGDLLGPVVVRGVASRLGLVEPIADSRTLFSIGSVLHHAASGDVVWGSGVNGKIRPESYSFDQLDVRAVRGPRTAEFLRNRGIAVPSVYGDPGLLVPLVVPELVAAAESKIRRVTVIPNLNDVAAYRGVEYLDPRSPLEEVLRTIAQSELVVGSSLHGVIVAESLGVPARLVKSSAEPSFKYDDYFLGTGRDGVTVASSVEEAVRMGGADRISYDPNPLLNAFPRDLWTPDMNRDSLSPVS